VPRFEPHPDRRPAIVTGASSGIGAATARTLASAGHPVVLGARRLERLSEIAREIVSDGGEAVALKLDLASPESIDAFAEEALRAFGPIEIMVSNAGSSAPGSALDAEPTAFRATLEVNLLAAHHLTRLVAGPMVERRRGDLVFVTSETVRYPRPGAAAYVTSKWGLEGLARTLQMELEGTGVRATIIQPGQTLTEMGSGWDPALAEEVLESWIHWGLARHNSFLRPESVGAAVLAAVSAPRGTHLAMIEVQPEAPVKNDESRERIGGGV
jgi:NAD(P)-dependent dehydrogenase (short-subunit alcohol dehydrogenase family)